MPATAAVLIQRQLIAATLSAALALGAVFPPAGAAAIGREGDQEQEGTADPGAPAAPDTAADPDFEPDGEDALPFDVGAPADESDDGAPVESEPVEDPDVLAVPLDEPEDGATDLAVPPPADAPPVTTPAPTPAAPPSPVPAPAAPAPTPVAPPSAAEPPTATVERAARQRKRDQAKRRRVARRGATARPVVTIPAAAPAPAPTMAVETAAAPQIERGSRWYAVQRGDCLWTIAVALLADDKLPSAKVQAEVDRLYLLNRDRIGEDPNKILSGTVLRLR